MPGKSNTNQTVSKKNLHRISSNTKAVDECFNEISSIFGRVIKHLGNSRISLALDDESIVQATIRGLLRSKSTKIEIRDIVILEKDESDTYYVIGIINDKKDINKLIKENRIPKWFLSVDLQINETSKKVDTSKNDSNIFTDELFNYEEPKELETKPEKSSENNFFGLSRESESKEYNIDDI